jgi:hypothetical protein
MDGWDAVYVRNRTATYIVVGQSFNMIQDLTVNPNLQISTKAFQLLPYHSSQSLTSLPVSQKWTCPVRPVRYLFQYPKVYTIR